ncbi:MAG: DNA alkylation repair protein [Pseudomonadota bacterium]
MNTHHAGLLELLKSNASAVNKRAASKPYLGNNSTIYNVPSPVLRDITRQWLAENKSLSPEAILAVVDSLIGGSSHEEKKLACFILGARKPVRSLATIAQLDQWLDSLSGWAEIDALCQSVFSVADVSPSWQNWVDFLSRLSKDTNINRRRASLVFLVGLTRKTDDDRFHSLAKANIRRLMTEKDVLITKTISWLLRCMIKTQRTQTALFLEEHAQALPAIAVRETRAKLKLGKKA